MAVLEDLGKTAMILSAGNKIIGIIAVADVSAPQSLSTYGDKFFLFKQQLEWVGIGLVALFVTSKIKYTCSAKMRRFQ